jgi:hypothetical protein
MGSFELLPKGLRVRYIFYFEIGDVLHGPPSRLSQLLLMSFLDHLSHQLGYREPS